jgi:hypothetical protein
MDEADLASLLDATRSTTEQACLLSRLLGDPLLHALKSSSADERSYGETDGPEQSRMVLRRTIEHDTVFHAAAQPLSDQRGQGIARRAGAEIVAASALAQACWEFHDALAPLLHVEVSARVAALCGKLECRRAGLSTLDDLTARAKCLNDVDMRVLVYLARAEGALQQANHLALTCNEISDVGFGALASLLREGGMPKMLELELFGNPLSAAADQLIEQLAERRPSLRIHTEMRMVCFTG